MVYYFTSTAVDPPAQLYVGKDKFENEELIKYGLEQDVWLQEGQTWDRIPSEVLEDCAQLTKANSIEGNKKDNVTIIYTPWSNLKKDGSMAPGQVGFKDQKKVKKIHVETRQNVIVNRLNKTKVEKFPDLSKEKADALKDAQRREQVVLRDKKKEEQRVAKERKEKAYQRDHMYDDIHASDAIAESNNQDRDPDFLDDFF